MEESNIQLKKNNKDLETKLTKLEDEVNLIGCDDYNVLSNSKRKTSNSGYHGYICDNTINGGDEISPDWKGEGWYRVIGPAGSKVADTPIELSHCGTAGSRYVQGSHPILIGETVKTKACYKDGNTLCKYPQNVKIRNCGTYFLYYLPNTSHCSQGYCTI